MPTELARLLFWLLPIQAIFAPWASAELLCSLLTMKKPWEHPRRVFFLLMSAMAIVVSLVRLVFPNMASFLLHLACFLSIVILFAGSLRQKAAAYLISVGMQIIPEALSVSLFRIAYRIVHRVSYPYSSVNLLTRIPDMLLMTAIYVSLGIPFIKRGARLLKRHSHSANLGALALIFFPLQFSGLMSYFFQESASGPDYPLRVALYWGCTIAALFPLWCGLMKIYRLEKRHAILKQQTDLVSRQLAFSQELEARYRELRKWNHDIKNHLLSLRYLINSEQYDKAAAYLDSLTESSQKEGDTP